MSSRFILVATMATAATLAWQSASAQASAPVSREQRKAETAAANKAGELAVPGGNLPPPKQTGKPSTQTREQRLAETAEANKAGQLTKTGGGEAPQAKSTAKPSTKTKADRAAEIEEARKKGEMVPAGGGGPGSK